MSGWGKAIAGSAGTLSAALVAHDWSAIAVLALFLVSAGVVICWILSSTARTNRLTKVIYALRGARQSKTAKGSRPDSDLNEDIFRQAHCNCTPFELWRFRMANWRCDSTRAALQDRHG